MSRSLRLLPLLLAMALAAAACSAGGFTIETSGGPTATPEPTGGPPPTGGPAPTEGPAPTTPPDPGPEARALADAMARWAEVGSADYAYTYVRNCECDDATRGPNRVVVSAGSVTSVESFDRPVDAEGYTIEQLFELIGRSIADGEQLAVSYDPDTGVPVDIALDIEAMEVDGGFAMQIHSFFDVSGELAELEAAEQRWAAAGITDYTMTYAEICFCPRFVVQVTVRDGAVFETTVLTGDREVEAAPTVEQLFDELRMAITEPVASLSVSYDADLGYPVDYFIDFLENVADEEFGRTVEELVPAA